MKVCVYGVRAPLLALNGVAKALLPSYITVIPFVGETFPILL
ncbi:hypothetical protein [Pararhizobium sp. DWP1-1-3]